MPLLIYRVAFFNIFFLCLAIPAANAQDSRVEFDAIKQRAIEFFLQTVDTSGAAEFVETQARSGEWADIQYDSKEELSSWSPIKHLERVLAIAVLYKKETQSLERKNNARRAVLLALNRWRVIRPISKNWWFNDIGVPLKLLPILLIFEDEIELGERKRLLPSVVGLSHIASGRDKGQNSVWYREISFFLGMVSNDVELVELSLKSLRSLASLHSEGEGMQVDMSFQQHGALPYSGAYGVDFVADMSRLASWAAGTKFGFSDMELNNLSNFLLEGIQPIVYRGDWLDWSMRGREFTREGTTEKLLSAVAGAAYQLSVLNKSHQSRLNNFYQNIKLKGVFPSSWIGNRHYWKSDFIVHQNSQMYFSVRMCSPQTIGTESYNEENLKGFWLPYGASYVLANGNEYSEIQHALQWDKIPGVTAFDVVPPINGLVSCEDQLAGGVSDGESGVFYGRLNKLGLTAKKSWFFHGATMVALGTDITSSTQRGVTTTVNQSRYSGMLKIDGLKVEISPGEEVVVRPKEIVHGDILYFFPVLSNVHLRRDVLVNDGRDINRWLAGKVRTADVLTIWISHGDFPVRESYVYGVRRNAGDAKNNEKGNAAVVLRNDSDGQSVLFESAQLIGAVAWKALSFSVGSGDNLSVDHPASLLVAKSAGKVAVAVSSYDPKVRSIKVEMRGKSPLFSKTIRINEVQDTIGKSVVYKTDKAVSH